MSDVKQPLDVWADAWRTRWRALRRENGWTQSAAADALAPYAGRRVSQTAVSHWETGQRVDWVTLRAIVSLIVAQEEEAEVPVVAGGAAVWTGTCPRHPALPGAAQGHLFCGGCGQRLAYACRACSQSNPLYARFCLACGMPLDEVPVEEAAE